MTTDISTDLSTLTTINEQIFTKLESKIIWCISNSMYEAIKAGENSTIIDLGFGTITILFDNNEIKYKFVPSQELEKVLTRTVINERNDLAINIESSLVSKLTNVYKTFF